MRIGLAMRRRGADHFRADRACGCGGGESASSGGLGGGAPMALGGDVHGGQNPVSGAQVFAYQAGSGGYGKGDLKIACTTTNTAGRFSFGSGSPACAGSGLPATLSCPATGSPELYLLAVGGNPGRGRQCRVGADGGGGQLQQPAGQQFCRDQRSDHGGRGVDAEPLHELHGRFGKWDYCGMHEQLPRRRHVGGQRFGA